MNREEQIDFNQEIQDYLQKNNVHQIFSQLVQSVAVEKPKDLLDFLIEQLQTPESLSFYI